MNHNSGDGGFISDDERGLIEQLLRDGFELDQMEQRERNDEAAAAFAQRVGARRAPRSRALVAAAASLALVGGGTLAVFALEESSERVEVRDAPTDAPLTLNVGETVKITPPFDGFDAYNYVPVVNGNSVLVLGARNYSSPQSPSDEETIEAAQFDIGGATWSELPPLPVESALYSAAAIEVGGALFVTGANCATTDRQAWHIGLFMCDSGSPLMLRLGDNQREWETVALPDELRFDVVAPRLGVRSESLLTVIPPRFDPGPEQAFEYNTVDGTWGAPIQADGDGGLCRMNDEWYSGTVIDERLQLSVLRNGAWQPFPIAVDTSVLSASCDVDAVVVLAVSEARGTQPRSGSMMRIPLDGSGAVSVDGVDGVAAIPSTDFGLPSRVVDATTNPVLGVRYEGDPPARRSVVIVGNWGIALPEGVLPTTPVGAPGATRVGDYVAVVDSTDDEGLVDGRNSLWIMRIR